MRKLKWVRHLATPILPPLVHATSYFITIPFVSGDCLPPGINFIQKYFDLYQSKDGISSPSIFTYLLYLLSASPTSMLLPQSKDFRLLCSLKDTQGPRILSGTVNDQKYLLSEILQDLLSWASCKGHFPLEKVGDRNLKHFLFSPYWFPARLQLNKDLLTRLWLAWSSQFLTLLDPQRSLR